MTLAQVDIFAGSPGRVAPREYDSVADLAMIAAMKVA